jgi:hypothetical protein
MIDKDEIDIIIPYARQLFFETSSKLLMDELTNGPVVDYSCVADDCFEIAEIWLAKQKAYKNA